MFVSEIEKNKRASEIRTKGSNSVKLNFFQKPHFSRLYLQKFCDDFLSFGVFNPNRVSNSPNSIKLVKLGQSETLSGHASTKNQKIFSKLLKIKF